MDQSLEQLCTALESIAKKTLDGWGDDRMLCENWGWHYPALSRHDLAAVPNRIAKRIRSNTPSALSADLPPIIPKMIAKITWLQANVIPHLYDGNGHQASIQYLNTLSYIESALGQLWNWESLQNNKAMPKNIANRLRTLNAQIDGIVIDKSDLMSKIQLIHDATEAAEDLPTNLEQLRETNEKVEKALKEVDASKSAIVKHAGATKEFLEQISTRKEEADKLVINCETAYRITTSKGLAGAFEDRAKKLANSMRLWVIGLILALGAGSWHGAAEFRAMSQLLSNSTVEPSKVVLQLIIIILGVGAPLWFAWMATKQIGQRFKLAEDYAFKASVSKAYEGYRREAAQLDQNFSSVLFASALARLDEHPSRFFDHENHGSPIHAALNSKAVNGVIDTIKEGISEHIKKHEKQKVIAGKAEDAKEKMG